MRRPIAILSLIAVCGLAAMADVVRPDARHEMVRDAVVAATTGFATALRLAGSAADATVRFGTRLPAVIAASYNHAPEMIIGLGTALSFPLVALGSFTIRWASRRRRDGRREARASQIISLVDRCPSSKAKAWLEVDGPAGMRDHELSGEMLRIGQDADNELALTECGLQQFHALIRRTPEAEFIVVDVTGIGGSGIAVNGRRLRSSQLQDGDRIELGHTTVTFHRAVRRVAAHPPGSSHG